ncbi:peptide ABC transporter substrate-binding protein [Ligilactobacillus sp. LYQ139]|uniref:peptide ABC transporter substrate-binding protein n=1 Tax=Ligilactobacillus sp. LYQ139 TaxID=3378800 RepID=UPI0038545E15
MKRRFLIMFSVLTALGLVLGGCQSHTKRSADTQTLNWDETAEMPTMDLSLATDTVSFDSLGNTLEGLYRIGKNDKIEPGVAVQTTVSPDKKTYTFKLRHSKWSNGDPVTAHDFVYSWRRTVNPKTASQYSYLFSGIKNADAIINGKKKPQTLGIKAEGNYKLVVTLSKPIPYFKLLMGFPVFFPQNQRVVERYGSKYGTASKYMVYNGPFKLTGWTGSNLSWKLVKNPTYWDRKHVRLHKIVVNVNKSTSTSYNLYESGQLDMTPLSSVQAKHLQGNPDLHVLQGATTAYLEFNQKRVRALRNPNIRKAIALAINRRQFVKQILGDGSIEPKGFVSAGLAKYNGKDFAAQAEVPQAVEYNQRLARQYWRKGLKQEGIKHLNLELLSDDTDAGKQSTDYLQSQLEMHLPGLKVTTNNVPFKTRLSRSANGNFDMVITMWGADFSDPITFMQLLTSNNPQNDGKWKNPQYDKDIKRAQGVDAGNRGQRWQDMVDAERVLMDSEGIAPLYQQNQSILLNPRVKGLIVHHDGVKYNWKNTYIAK